MWETLHSGLLRRSSPLPSWLTNKAELHTCCPRRAKEQGSASREGSPCGSWDEGDKTPCWGQRRCGGRLR